MNLIIFSDNTMQDLPRASVSLAASLAGIAFVSMLVGVPLMLNDVANLEVNDFFALPYDIKNLYRQNWQPKDKCIWTCQTQRGRYTYKITIFLYSVKSMKKWNLSYGRMCTKGVKNPSREKIERNSFSDLSFGFFKEKPYQLTETVSAQKTKSATTYT